MNIDSAANSSFFPSSCLPVFVPLSISAEPESHDLRQRSISTFRSHSKRHAWRHKTRKYKMAMSCLLLGDPSILPTTL